MISKVIVLVVKIETLEMKYWVEINEMRSYHKCCGGGWLRRSIVGRNPSAEERICVSSTDQLFRQSLS